MSEGVTPQGTLEVGEIHPAAKMAHDYLKGVPAMELLFILSSMSSCAIEHNRLADICAETLRRLLAGEPVSDRYILGLAWVIREIKDRDIVP